MTQTFNLDGAYSTTRKVTKVPPQPAGVLLLPKSVKQGGLRTKGLYKQNEDDNPLITIVTVVYNGAEFLEDTIKSVINQTYNNVEYIVVDGGSTDATLDIIARYDGLIDYWVSEQDSGIYNAMNKAICLATGKWLSFQNADDFLHDASVVEKIKHLFLYDIDFIYGKYNFMYNDKIVMLGVEQSFSSLSVGSICHQAVFCKLNLIQDFSGFDEKYRIAADYDFFVKVFKAGTNTKYIDVVISTVRFGGVSSKFSLSTAKERLDIVRKNYNVCLSFKAYLHYFVYVRLYLVYDYFRRLLKKL